MITGTVGTQTQLKYIVQFTFVHKMFSIFNKKKNSDQLNVPEHTPTPLSAINTESIIADENYKENELNDVDVPIDDELDLGNLSSGPRQPILKVSRFLITTYMYIYIINKIFKNLKRSILRQNLEVKIEDLHLLTLVSLIGSSIVLKKIACFVFHAVFLELLVKRKIHLL